MRNTSSSMSLVYGYRARGIRCLPSSCSTTAAKRRRAGWAANRAIAQKTLCFACSVVSRKNGVRAVDRARDPLSVRALARPLAVQGAVGEDELHGLGVCSIEETGNDMTYVSLAP